MNHEKQDRETPEARLEAAVYGDVVPRADEPTGERSARSAPIDPVVPGPETSLDELLLDRKVRGISEVEGIDEQLEALTQKRRALIRELSAIEMTLEGLKDA